MDASGEFVAEVTLRGVAVDAEDGAFTGASPVWTDRVNGGARGEGTGSGGCTRSLNRSQILEASTRRYGILAVYLFGSRAEDGSRKGVRPLHIDLVPLQQVDALFQFEAIDGERVAASDPLAADQYELVVMRRAAELLPIERQLERDSFGVSTV